jgi:hypothetical protein
MRVIFLLKQKPVQMYCEVLTRRSDRQQPRNTALLPRPRARGHYHIQTEKNRTATSHSGSMAAGPIELCPPGPLGEENRSA